MENITKAIQLKKELDKLRPLTKEGEARIMQKFRLDWNYHSNHIEGNSLDYGETKALILFGITAQGKPLKDHLEVQGHNEAIEWILEVVKQQRPITENFIRELHQLILKNPYEVDTLTPDGKPSKKQIKIGEYKTTPNHVKTRTGEIFYFATPEETPAKMYDLIEWYKSESTKDNVNPILLAGEFHYKFIRIHPFDDGNGRTVRILMNFILMQFAYPPVIIKTEDKANYYAVLEQADAGKIEPFIDYIAQNLVHSLELMIKGAKGENIEEPDDIDKEVALLERTLEGIDSPVEVSKTKQSLLNIYDNSLTRLIDKFIEKCKLLDRFYLKSRFSLGTLARTVSDFNIDKINDFVYKQIEEHSYLDKINLEYYHQYFKYENFDEFSTQSKINIILNEIKYTIIDYEKNIEITKAYSQQLTDEDINQLVNAEIKRHKAFIEKKIQEYQNKKDD